MSAESVLRSTPQKRLRSVWLGAIMILIILKIVALSPVALDQNTAAPKSIDLNQLVLKEDHTLAPGIPQGKVPDYAIDQFNYVSTHNDEKQWNLLANQAFLFNAEKLVHARTVRANLYDTEGKITVVTGLEAKYMMNRSDLEVFGNVETTFPDGWVVRSEYVRYMPKERRIEIPVSYPVSGVGQEQNGQIIHFTSQGLDFAMDTSDIYLPKDAKFIVNEGNQDTTVLSDHCLIHRKINQAEFTMDLSRPNDTRFVRIEEPTMLARGRTGKLIYGAAPNTIQQMTLFDDVLVKEFRLKKNGTKILARYGTGGRGDFDSQKNTIVLTIYPQVYQDEDTLTGDRITLHRQSDIVEVEHSNAFSTGTQSDDDSPQP